MSGHFTKFATLILSVLICISVNSYGQSQEPKEDQVVINLNEIENDGKRVEVQRYIGYENLFNRYITLPYDVSLNTTNQGRYFDIGFVIISLVPIALLLLAYKNKRNFYVLILLLILYLSTCFSYSYVNIDKLGAVQSNADNWTEATSGDQVSSYQSILSFLYESGQIISYPFRFLSDQFSGETDHITYPLLFVFFVIIAFTVTRVYKNNPRASMLSIIMVMYLFLWLLLSGGIIWYGLLLLPILLAFSIKNINGSSYLDPTVRKIIESIGIAIISIWIILAFAARVSNIDFFTNEANKGLGIVDSKLIYYTTGMHSEQESQNLVYQNIGDTFEQINANEGLIFQVGTSATFNIKKNTERVFQDNVLTKFFDILNKYRNNKIIIDVLRASGYKYIIVDLYTPTLDKTPEKSLTKKYQLFLSCIYESDKVKLLATDRIMEVRSQDEVKTYNDVFIKDYNPDDKVKVRAHGSYAIYEIL